jgi:hypothetical protein
VCVCVCVCVCVLETEHFLLVEFTVKRMDCLSNEEVCREAWRFLSLPNNIALLYLYLL